jgi:preprotein translocase subunit Sec63
VTRLFFVLVIAIAVVIILRALRPVEPRASRAPTPVPNPRMTRAEALEVLGLAEGASRDEVQAAYKRLIRKVHPDAPGGSGYLASKLNQAKQTLLG